jgi:membrane fusion protein, copper/silver efflux system
MNKKRIFTAGLGIIIIPFILLFIGLSGCSQKADTSKEPGHSDISHYTCGMHPSVKVSVEDYDKGDVNCPICNMKLVPVKKEVGSSLKKVASAHQHAEKGKKILFYRNPMNPSITSKVPTKDDMGMDFIPVYQEESNEIQYYGCGMKGVEHVYTLKELEDKGIKDMICPGCTGKLRKLTKEEAEKLKGVIKKVSINTEEIKLADIKTEIVERLRLHKELRAVAKVAYDIKLYRAQAEYLSALSLKSKMGNALGQIQDSATSLITSAERKLFIMGMNKPEIKNLAKSGAADESLILPSKKSWVYGNIYENEISWIKEGAEVEIFSESFPGEKFLGKISSINPIVDSKTRTLVFRAQVKNPKIKLKPEMFVDTIIKTKYISPRGEKEVLAVRANAVLNTGTRTILWVQMANGKYEARNIIKGNESYTLKYPGIKFVPILSGVKEGERIVLKGNFLIDSQSQITGVSSAYGGSLSGE